MIAKLLLIALRSNYKKGKNETILKPNTLDYNLKKFDNIRFKKVFKQYYNPLCNFAATIVNDHKAAQDVVQDVFTKLWDKRDKIDIQTNEKTYLFQAVKHRAYEVLRKRKTESKILPSEFEESFDDSNTIDQQAKEYMLKDILFKSIRQLPPKCQEIFVMNKVNGLTYNEIAEDLEISVKTVENHIGKAFRKLREMMSDTLSELN